MEGPEAEAGAREPPLLSAPDDLPSPPPVPELPPDEESPLPDESPLAASPLALPLAPLPLAAVDEPEEFAALAVVVLFNCFNSAAGTLTAGAGGELGAAKVF